MGQKISHIFSSTVISNPGTRDFSQNLVFARVNSVRDSWYPATEKPKNVSPCPPYITIALRRVPRGTLFLGSQEIPVAKKCPPPLSPPCPPPPCPPPFLYIRSVGLRTQWTRAKNVF